MAPRKRFSRYDNIPFSLWLRAVSQGRKVYYVRFKNEDGTYKTAQSSGQTSKEAAMRWAYQQLASGEVVTKRTVKFRDFADGFFDWDGPYVSFKRQRGQQIGQTHCRHMNSYLTNYLIPYFGDMKLSSITSRDVEQWQNAMLHNTELSARSLNHMLICLRSVFKEALKQTMVGQNPCEGVLKLKEDMRERGVLTLKETVTLFRDPGIWPDPRIYLMAKLSAFTGMRQGELVGLKRKYVHDYYIEVVHSWEARFGLKDPKTKKSRRHVLITGRLYEELKTFMDKAPFQDGEDFVFYSDKREKPYTNDKGIGKQFYQVLARIGIKEEERAQRGVVFHSLRHFFNTYLRSHGVADSLIRDFMGHSSAAMTENYTHRLRDDYQPILTLQESLLEEKGDLP